MVHSEYVVIPMYSSITPCSRPNSRSRRRRSSLSTPTPSNESNNSKPSTPTSECKNNPWILSPPSYSKNKENNAKASSNQPSMKTISPKSLSSPTATHPNNKYRYNSQGKKCLNFSTSTRNWLLLSLHQRQTLVSYKLVNKPQTTNKYSRNHSSLKNK